MSFDAIRHKLQSEPYLWAYIVGSVALIASSILWWFFVYLGPQHVFWSMIHSSLASASVTTVSSQKSGANSLEQLVHVDTQKQLAQSLTTLKQDNTTVKTEIIGTTAADFTRYLAIESQAKADTSKVKNVWSKSDDTKQTDTQAGGHQLYAQAALGIGLPIGSVPVPIADMPADRRQALYEYIRNQNVYQPDFAHVKKERKEGRLLYTYDVKIQTVLYVSLMKAFAKDLGLHELDAANPNSYQNNPLITVSLTVDALSHQLSSVNFTQLGYSMKYTAYGVALQVMPPKQFISNAELQQRLGAIGQATQQ